MLCCLSLTYKHTLGVDLLNKSSSLAAALGVYKFITVIAMNSVTLCFAAKV
jgi:hypothetical protein